MAKDIDRVFSKNFAAKYFREGRHEKEDKLLPDVRKLVEEYHEDRLFQRVPGRSHDTFPSHKSKLLQINNPHKFNARLKKYAKNLDNYASNLPI